MADTRTGTVSVITVVGARSHTLDRIQLITMFADLNLTHGRIQLRRQYTPMMPPAIPVQIVVPRMVTANTTCGVLQFCLIFFIC